MTITDDIIPTEPPPTEITDDERDDDDHVIEVPDEMWDFYQRMSGRDDPTEFINGMFAISLRDMLAGRGQPPDANIDALITALPYDMRATLEEMAARLDWDAPSRPVTGMTK